MARINDDAIARLWAVPPSLLSPAKRGFFYVGPVRACCTLRESTREHLVRLPHSGPGVGNLLIGDSAQRVFVSFLGSAVLFLLLVKPLVAFGALGSLSTKLNMRGRYQ